MFRGLAMRFATRVSSASSIRIGANASAGAAPSAQITPPHALSSIFGAPSAAGASSALAPHRLRRCAATSAYQQQQYESAADSSPIADVDFTKETANSISLIGNVGQTPEVRYLESGNKLTKVLLAFAPGKNSATQWFEVEAWGGLAEPAAAEISKGQRVAVEGYLKVDAWSDAVTGQQRTKLKVVATAINRVRLDRPPSPSGGASSWQSQQPSAPSSFNSDAQGAAQAPAAASGAGAVATTEELWMNFFEDTSGWYDNRGRKSKENAPDFKRKEGGREAPALWIDSRATPAWVKQELEKLDKMNEGVPPF